MLQISNYNLLCFERTVCYICGQYFIMARLEKLITEPVPHFFLTNVPHDIIGCHSLHTEYGNFPPKLPVTGSEWQVFLPSKYCGNDISDPLTELTRQKARFIEKFNQESKKLSKQKAKLTHLIDSYSNALNSSCDSAIMSGYELQLVNIVKSDPDKFFFGSYNWYCGGQISNIKIDNEPFIATVQGRRSDQLQIVPVRGEEQKWFIDLGATLTIKTANNILYETVYSKEIIGIRSRNKCTLYKVYVNNDNILEAVECFHEICKKPAISIDIDPKCSRFYCSLDITGNLTFWDTHKKSKLSEYATRKRDETNLPDNWGQVKFSPFSNIVNLANRFKFQITDLRNQSTETIWKVSDSHLLHPCENISFLLPSSVSSFDIYLGTTHHVLLLDTRNVSNIKQIWTHMMKSEPQYAYVSSYNNDEILIIGNQEPAEIEVICNNNSNTQPIMLSSLKDSLRKSNVHGHNLQPNTKDRTQLSAGGLTCLENKNSLGLTVLLQTARGDIFSNQLYDSFISDFESSSNIPCWEYHFNTNVNSKFSLYGTETVNMAHIYKRLRDIDDKMEYQFNSYVDKDAKRQDKWQVTRDTLQGYQDMLAPRILSIWDINSLNLKKKQGRYKPLWKKYVKEWLNKT